MRRVPPTLPEFVAVYGLLYAAFGVQSPFLPALLREQGLHPEEIGIVLVALSLSSVALPLCCYRGSPSEAPRPNGLGLPSRVIGLYCCAWQSTAAY